MSVPAVSAVEAFAAKWLAARPELAVALRFVDPHARDLRLAADGIGREIEHAALRIRDAAVATRKLEWWLAELEAMATGQARHPLTRALAGSVPAQRAPASAWAGAIAAALALREHAPASTLEDLLEPARRLHRPFVALAGLADALDVACAVEARALASAFRDALAIDDTLAAGRLPLPLDLLARHRLARGDLADAGAAREAVLGEHFAMLGARMGDLDVHRLPVLDAAALHAERWRCRRLARRPTDAARCADRLPWSTAWVAWRASRAQPASFLP